jgi:hypothetical protein
VAMSHKAFTFDWTRFDADDLYRIVVKALSSGDTAELGAYIDANLKDLKDPYEGKSLPKDWREMLENRDVHELADFALTRFYDPSQDWGIWDQWRAVDERLPAPDQVALLGTSLGSDGKYFDPGREGSYFQTLSQVSESLERLRNFRLPGLEDYRRKSLDRFEQLLVRCVESGSGLYVTF